MCSTCVVATSRAMPRVLCSWSRLRCLDPGWSTSPACRMLSNGWDSPSSDSPPPGFLSSIRTDSISSSCHGGIASIAQHIATLIPLGTESRENMISPNETQWEKFPQRKLCRSQVRVFWQWSFCRRLFSLGQIFGLWVLVFLLNFAILVLLLRKQILNKTPLLLKFSGKNNAIFDLVSITRNLGPEWKARPSLWTWSCFDNIPS